MTLAIVSPVVFDIILFEGGPFSAGPVYGIIGTG